MNNNWNWNWNWDWLFGPKALVSWIIGPVRNKGVRFHMGTLVMTAAQKCDLSVTITDLGGNPAEVQDPVWSSTDETVATVTVDANDPLKAVVVSTGVVGSCTVNLTADADLSEGVKNIIGTLEVVVKAGEAAIINIVPGTPTNQ